MMMQANLVQVAYGAATWKLDDKAKYPNFLRAQPSQERTTANVVQLLKNLTYSEKAKINSVVLVHTDTSYGSDGAEVSELADAIIYVDRFKMFKQRLQYHKWLDLTKKTQM